MKTYVIYNKKSNNNNGATGAFKIKEIWTQKELVYKEVNEFSTYRELFDSISPEDEVVLCGGDGTLNFLVNEIDCDAVENRIYYYPTGSGNDFWTDLGKSTGDGPVLINDYIVKLPTVIVNGMRKKFINGIGYGIDGYCCEEGDRSAQRASESRSTTPRLPSRDCCSTTSPPRRRSPRTARPSALTRRGLRPR